MSQFSATDATLAQFSLDAYSDAPALPAGFTAAPLTLSPTPGASYANGVYHSGSGAALADVGTLNGVPTLVVSFRGSDDRVDSLHDLQGINAAYSDFAALVSAVDAYAASGAVQQVVVTGHSLGGAMAQLYMASHPDQPGGVTHEAVTFGSPGAELPSGLDSRIDNIVIADDPAVLLGAHRAEVGAALRADPHLAQAAAQEAATDFPGLTAQDALASLPTLTADYLNRGDITLLPGSSGKLDPSALLQPLPQEHSMSLYLAQTEAAVAGTLPTQAVSQQPATAQEAFDRAVYDSDFSNVPGVTTLVQQSLDAWADSHGQLNEAQQWLTSLQHDLHLL
jgi:pimeloyl-ACP methyl ester carboxylesterase